MRFARIPVNATNCAVVIDGLFQRNQILSSYDLPFAVAAD
jgi:hypothetical protein